MILKNELLEFLDTNLETSRFENVDASLNGLQVEGKDEIKKIVFAVSATKETISKAYDLHADALIVHHGIFWKTIGVQKIAGPFAKRIRPLIERQINLFAYHLPLDAHLTLGNNAQIAQSLNLKKTTAFADYNKKGKELFIGVQGELPKKMTEEELKIHLENLFKHNVILGSSSKEFISKIGIVSGGAGSMWKEALGLDAFITGELSLHQYDEAKEGGVSLYACGHNATEVFGISALKTLIEKKYSLECVFLNSTNPL